ncbi:MAG: hypothetical protein AAF609_19625 [Cyanobacteria bacterium P01_C01_bin.120]
MQVEAAPSQLCAGAQMLLGAAPTAVYKRIFAAEILDVIPPAMLTWRGG